MVSSVSSHSHRISFVAILDLFIRIFAFLSDVNLLSFSLSLIFINLIWCIFLKICSFISFVSALSSQFSYSILSVYSSCCIILFPFLLFSSYLSFVLFLHYKEFPLLAFLVPGVPSLVTSSICLIYASVNLLSFSIYRHIFASLFTSIYCLFFKFFVLRVMYVCLVLHSSD